MNGKWGSRKLWILITSVVGILGTALSQSVTIEEAMIQVVRLVIAYFGANTAVHIAKAIGGLYNGNKRGS